MMALCLLEVVPATLLIMFYLGIPLMFLVNVNQLLMFGGLVALSRGLPRKAMPIIAFALILILISFVKGFSIAGPGNYDFRIDAVFSYYYSLIMPALIFISVYSLGDLDAADVLDELRWFSKWFLILIAPAVMTYVVLNSTGRIAYFGFGVNFHYAAPYFMNKVGVVGAVAVLILLSGKRSTLINFLFQYGLFIIGKSRRSPVPIILILLGIVASVFAAWDSLEFLLRRFTRMIEAYSNADLSSGLIGLSNSYESIVLFGGRLEEVVGVVEYFVRHPNQIWFGSPPGANYVWRVELSELETVKSFAHLTWLGYAFRFGVIPLATLLGYFVYMLLSGKDTQNPLWLVFAGTLVSSTFGGNLFYSPVAWTMIAMYMRYGKAISAELKRNSKR